MHKRKFLAAFLLTAGLLLSTPSLLTAQPPETVQPGGITDPNGAAQPDPGAGQPPASPNNAEVKQPEEKREEGKPPPPPPPLTFWERMQGSWMLLLMLGGFMVLWIFMGRTRRKQMAKRREMLSALKKGDKVLTASGILGTVMEVRGNEVVVKVDENNNVRMRFARWAIHSVGEAASEEPPQQG